MKTKAVIFDFDGTLSNRATCGYYMFRNMLRKFMSDIDEHSIEFEAMIQDLMTYDEYGTISKQTSLTCFAKKYPISKEMIIEMATYWDDNFYRFQILNKNTIPVLTYLKENGYKIGCITNGASNKQNKKLDYSDIRKYFDAIIVSGDIDTHKPDPKIFEIMAKELDVPCEQCMFVGDTFSTDILGAYRAKMKPVWIWNDPYRPCDFDVTRIYNIEEVIDVLKNER